MLAAGGPPSFAAAQAEAPVNLSRTTGPSDEPATAVSGGDALVAWNEGGQIWTARRAAGAWMPAGPIPGASGSTPAVAVGPDGAFHVAWSGFSLVDDNYEVYYSRLRGGDWEMPENVSGTPADSIGPTIAARADGAILLAWAELASDGPQIVAASRTAGTGWSKGPVPDAEGTSPAVVAGMAGWHLAWSQAVELGQATEILYMVRTAAGWSLPEVVSASPAVTSSDASLALSAAGMPAIAWLDGDREVGFSRRLAGGWTDPQPLATFAGGSLGVPSIAATGDGYDVAWALKQDVLLLPNAGDGAAAPRPVMSFARRAAGTVLTADGDGSLAVAEGRAETDAGDVYAVRVGRADGATATATATATLSQGTATPTPATSPPATPTARTATATAGRPTPTIPSTTSPTPPPSPVPTTAVPPIPSATTAPGARIYLPAAVRLARLTR